MWISFGSMHEVRAFRERKKRSVWFRELVVQYHDEKGIIEMVNSKFLDIRRVRN